MNYPLTGYHHITACAGGAQEDVNFFTQAVGLRMAKQTVLMDGSIPIYHLYYSNANLEPGSVMTTFPYSRKPGRPGSGQVSATAFTVAKGSLPFWKDHLKRHNVDQDAAAERFGQSFIRFRHPAGLAFEVIEDQADPRQGWTTPEITSGEAARGFHGAVLSVREIGETERFFVDALGFRKTGVDGSYHRFETGSGGANKTVTLLHQPDRPAGSWTFGAGTVHHIAWRTEDEARQIEWRADLVERGYNVTPVMDRSYFHSIYYREPGGILFEIATDPPGFSLDEATEHLGEQLKLPSWLEVKREAIERALPRLAR